MWRRRAGGGAALAEVTPCPPAAQSGLERAAVEAEAKRKAVKHVLDMVLDLVARRSIFKLLPWDPTVLPVLLRKHAEVGWGDMRSLGSPAGMAAEWAGLIMRSVRRIVASAAILTSASPASHPLSRCSRSSSGLHRSMRFWAQTRRRRPVPCV